MEVVDYLVCALFLLPLVTFLFPKLLSWLISWYLSTRYTIRVRISSIGFFNLKGLKIVLADKITIEIAQVWLSSSLLSSSHNALIGITISDARVHCLFEDRTVCFEVDNLLVMIPKKEKLVLTSGLVTLVCDNHQIICCEHVRVVNVPALEASQIVNRAMFGDGVFEMKTNPATLIEIEHVRIRFPHKYNFAETFNEKFMSTTKWFRKMHSKDNAEETIAETVGRDIAVKLTSFVMEVEDDPFESRLRNNYQLLKDEFNEKTRRSQLLNEKLEQLRRTNFLSDAKMNELRAALAKKDADIYIQRHSQGFNDESAVRNLFTVEAVDIHIQLAADSSMTGYEKKLHIMKHELDAASPFPEDLAFSTLWCRKMRGNIESLVCRLRDFPKPMMDIDKLRISGTLMGAEQKASSRARRTVEVKFGPGTEPIIVERTMPTLKFYHDLTVKVDTWNYTHGACWEPVLSQLSLSFELISRPSIDPSPSLTWWDKMRFLFHGPFFVEGENISLFFHGSLDPYNSTELIEIGFTRTLIQWLTGRILISGNVDLLVHTASKYDECRIVHLPNIDAQIYLDWLCLGSQYDHHSVMPCAADKVPEYSSHQVHDSYRAFRSQNLNVKLSIESKQIIVDPDDIPSVLMYSSSIRWFDNQKQIFSGITRLTRRGILFGNMKPRKLAFSRIFKKVRVSVCLHKLRASYWSSFNKTWGCEILGGHLSHSAEHTLSLVPYDDALSRRARPIWGMAYMNSEISDVEIWLHRNKIAASADRETGGDSKKHLLSFSRVSYNREDKNDVSPSHESSQETPPTHRLIVYDLRGAWTKDNKDVVFALFDLFMKSQQLKRNLSTEALKGFKVEDQTMYTGTSPVRGRHSTTSPGSTLNKGHAASMLKNLIAESEINPNVIYSADIDNELINDEVKLKGVSACQDGDVIHKNWLIELVNSQVMLRGCETSGYVIASSAKTQIWQKIHRPVWKEHTLYSKQSWVGAVEFMQYYATVDATLDSDVVWLSVDNIQEKDTLTVTEIPDLVGISQSVGGVVSSVVQAEDGSVSPTGSMSAVQLQRIISRCSCEFYYAGFTEDVDPEFIHEVPPLPDDDHLVLEPWDNEVAVDSFTIMHHELDVSTNSQQFEMIIDLVNNLLLFVEPHRKEAVEKVQNMRFQFQLYPMEDQRGPISQLQDELRKLVLLEKQRERESYMAQRTLDENPNLNSASEDNLRKDLEAVEEEVEKYKARINELSDQLAMMIGCFKEAQITADKTRERQEAAAGGNFVASLIKRIEVCFKQASWRLTDSDGQLGLADLVLQSFLYTKIAKNDDSVEHSLELGYICVLNLLPNQVYKTVLQPTALKDNIPLDRHRALRIFCRERAPVGGISVKEHFEVNVVPLTIEVTHAFFKKMLKFFFPDPEVNAVDEKQQDRVGKASAKKRGGAKKEEVVSSSAASSVSGAAASSSGDKIARKVMQTSNAGDIEKMRERAQRNQTFCYIKIPEVPIRVSYKGNKLKNIEDINNFSLILPTIEYHNQTWTWLDVLMAIKNESKHRLLSQAVKQKLHIKPPFFSSSQAPDDAMALQAPVNQDEDEDRKARLLLGNLAAPTLPRKSKLSFFKKN